MQVIINKRLLNLREKFLLGPGLEPESPALRTGTLPTAPLRRITKPSQNLSPLSNANISVLHYGQMALVPVRRVVGIHLGGAVASTPARRTGHPDSSPGVGENFSLKLTTLELLDC